MIYFPVPYPDEILYSVLARYAVRSDVTSRETIAKELFGRNLVFSNNDLPHGIGALINNLPMGSYLSEELLIYKHTLFPLYTAFLPLENINLIYEGMIGNNGREIYVKSGLATSTIKKNDYLRFCRQCFEEDMEIYGESYFRRQHQVPGLMVCKKHKCFLQDSKISNGEDTKRKFVTANEESCSIDKDCFEKFMEGEKNYTSEAEIIALRDEILKKSLILCEYIDFLLNHKLVSQKNAFFINKYIDVLRERGLTNGAGFTYPDKIQEQFLNYHGYNFLKVTQSVNDINDSFNWLYLFFRKNKAIRHPIRHLLVCMFLEINLESLFNAEIKGKGRVISKMDYEPRRKKEDVRKKWLRLMEQNPGASRGELQAVDKGTHIWLLRYDKKWYDKVSPKRKKMNVPKDKKPWEIIDKEAVAMVEEALMDIQEDEKKPIRITKNYLLRKISQKVKIYNLDKLPLTKHKIESATESLEQYRERKMRWAIKNLLEDGKYLTMWNVLRQMGIGIRISDKLKRDIENAIEKSIRAFT